MDTSTIMEPAMNDDVDLDQMINAAESLTNDLSKTTKISRKKKKKNKNRSKTKSVDNSKLDSIMVGIEEYLQDDEDVNINIGATEEIQPPTNSGLDKQNKVELETDEFIDEVDYTNLDSKADKSPNPASKGHNEQITSNREAETLCKEPQGEIIKDTGASGSSILEEPQKYEINESHLEMQAHRHEEEHPDDVSLENPGNQPDDTIQEIRLDSISPPTTILNDEEFLVATENSVAEEETNNRETEKVMMVAKPLDKSNKKVNRKLETSKLLPPKKVRDLTKDINASEYETAKEYISSMETDGDGEDSTIQDSISHQEIDETERNDKCEATTPTLASEPIYSEKNPSISMGDPYDSADEERSVTEEPPISQQGSSLERSDNMDEDFSSEKEEVDHSEDGQEETSRLNYPIADAPTPVGIDTEPVLDISNSKGATDNGINLNEEEAPETADVAAASAKNGSDVEKQITTEELPRDAISEEPVEAPMAPDKSTDMDLKKDRSESERNSENVPEIDDIEKPTSSNIPQIGEQEVNVEGEINAKPLSPGITQVSDEDTSTISSEVQSSKVMQDITHDALSVKSPEKKPFGATDQTTGSGFTTEASGMKDKDVEKGPTYNENSKQTNVFSINGSGTELVEVINIEESDEKPADEKIEEQPKDIEKETSISDAIHEMSHDDPELAKERSSNEKLASTSEEVEEGEPETDSKVGSVTSAETPEDFALNKNVKTIASLQEEPSEVGAADMVSDNDSNEMKQIEEKSDKEEGLEILEHEEQDNESSLALDNTNQETEQHYDAAKDTMDDIDAFLKDLEFEDDSELNALLTSLNENDKTKDISKKPVSTKSEETIKTSDIKKINMAEPVYIFTSLAGGGFHMIPRTNRLSTILQANRVDFTYRDLGTDDEARKVWKTYGRGRSLPSVVRGRDNIIGNWEEIEEINEDYKLRQAIYEEF
ncbi:hypothetical protein KAFR_0C04460 [Kazachstania africana CBS 2517]|uniref:Uncharacterized protein n=1 Tax=Kazachstania africana (strain ATCC 22294 / BCRC 22015 / CBS 2517 / CECT 1963 / NBRC 1671 / NRRL Y-8276) TaxID=1071382 RepID=H2AST7_KAZAF|nr:hypothetical protein KAFR_0C04460 [Kazachstania africana CBS 2517]CCF57437.1 hypothetical protein KAFR_0C04460 [Kazachstania africana CBS 2517]